MMAPVEGPADDNPGANPGADADVDQVLRATPGPEAQLAQGGQVDVVLHIYGQVETFAQELLQIQVVPAQAGRPSHHTLVVQGHPRGADANAADLLARGPGRFEQLL